MKVKSITLQNYKKFVDKTTFSFTDSDGEINGQTLIVGDNGAGKSSILQGIVALVASATREKFSPSSLDWPGYEYRHLQTGKLPLNIEVEVVFSKEEIETTRKYALELKKMIPPPLLMPNEKKTVNLVFNSYNNRVVAREGRNAFLQFKGYQYAKTLTSTTPNKNTLFESIGNIYWYTEQRNSYNTSNFDNKNQKLDGIRNFLSNVYAYHVAVQNGRNIREGEFDFYAKLEDIYSKVFSGRSFVGAAPRFDVYEASKAPDFFLSDGRNQYELSGMSAGERAIFPILMDFAHWNINNSIIIIDELELHLHPPLQQMLLRALPKLGKNNQFIFTSHSDSVFVMFDESENQIIRLPNE